VTSGKSTKQTDVISPNLRGNGSDAEDIPAAAISIARSGGQSLTSGKRVHVETDLFEAEIDTVGGDLRIVGLRTYPDSIQQSNQPFQLMKDNGSEVFIAQSGLVALDNLPAPNHYAQFAADQTEYRLSDGQEMLEVRLYWVDATGIKVTKNYKFKRGSFLIELNQIVENSSGADWRGRQYRQFQRTPPETTSSYFSSGVVTYTGAVISSSEKRYEKISFEDIAKKELSKSTKDGWIAMIQHYFLSAWIPNAGEVNDFYTRVTNGNHYLLGMRSSIQNIHSGESGNFSTKLYVGPKLPDVLERIAPNLQLTVDYGVLTIIAEPLFWLLKSMHILIGNWGWAIIFLTITIKLGFYKLSETSYRSMANMRRLAPELARIKNLYSDDKQRMNQEMMTLYKKEKVNPLGGCLPILVQIPVFIALYWVLVESVQLRQAPFMLWIKDMSVPDPYYFLPLIMGGTMLVQQKLSPSPPDPVQAKVMMALPIVFTLMFLWFPAGLVLYWVVNNMLSIAQQWIITKRVELGVDNNKKNCSDSFYLRARKLISLLNKMLYKSVYDKFNKVKK
jgi:YidC/Oxa1 family membrane protein insertase